MYSPGLLKPDFVRKLRRFPHVVVYNCQRLLLNPLVDHVLLNEYPRSGGSWIAKVVAEATGVPGLRTFSLQRQVIHEHRLDLKGTKQVYVIRDGRDMFVSNYFHSFFVNEMNNRGRVIKMRREFDFSDYNDVRSNLGPYLRRMLTKPVDLPFIWQEFCAAALSNPNGLIVRYEDMKEEPQATIRRIIEFYQLHVSAERICAAVERHHVGRYATGRPDRHVRKGIIGDWKNYFDKHSAKEFDRLAGEYLVHFGYESNRDWVTDVD